MFHTLSKMRMRDKDFPERTWWLQVLRSVLDGTMYDALRYSFQEERNSSKEYIPLRERRPSVRYNLCRTVVQDSVSMLFGDGHFPAVQLASGDAANTVAAIIKETRLPQVMIDAALRGSVGSIAILMRVLKGRIFFDVMDTDYLTPEYDPEEPDTLLSVTERYKVKGSALKASGYDIEADKLNSDFWFQRVWDRQSETWYLPYPVAVFDDSNRFKTVMVDEGGAKIDGQRTVNHAIGFVPIVWIRNLPFGSGVDGACTFRPAIDTQIEIEYQLSQAGRGLKYSSDPLLMIREPAAGEEGKIVRSPANALIVSAENGDAKMLEINGTAASAVIEYVRTLRENAIESIHGNRSNADKISAAQSGRALEIMNQPLVRLADRLRTSYGENGLLPLIRMVIAVANKMTIKVNGKQIDKMLDVGEPTLRWPPWFSMTSDDRQKEATALQTLAQAGHISRETAVKSLAASFDVEDIPAELSRIEADQAAADARATKMGAQVKANDDLPE